MPKINIYLNFPGNAEAAFTFYKSIFGGEFSSAVRFKDLPVKGMTLEKADENKMMHISLPIGKDVLMASDNLESTGRKLLQGNNVYVFVQPETKDEAARIFNALSVGGSVEMPIADQMWGDYYGSFIDKFGVPWMVDYGYPKTK